MAMAAAHSRYLPTVIFHKPNSVPHFRHTLDYPQRTSQRLPVAPPLRADNPADVLPRMKMSRRYDIAFVFGALQ